LFQVVHRSGLRRHRRWRSTPAASRVAQSSPFVVGRR